MKRKSTVTLMAIFLALAFATAAFAGLSAVGPFNLLPSSTTSNGFPQTYTDANGVAVELPIPPIATPTATMIFGPLTATSNAVAKLAGFDTEAFYFNARPDPKTYQTAYGKIVVVFGLEASYATGIPTDGQQIVFARIRIKAPVKVAGDYTFFHPWGSEIIHVTQADITGTNKGIFFTKDVGLTLGWLQNPDGTFSPAPSPGGFYNVLQTSNSMSTFLRAVSPAPPAGWIGDGLTPATVTGSPSGYNKVRLEGPDPNLDGKNHNFVETTQFVVSGHIPPIVTAIPLPLSVDRVTCSYLTTAAGPTENINLFLTSKQGVTVTVTDGQNGQPLPVSPFPTTVTDVSGKYFASFPGTTKSITVAVSTADTAFTTTTKTVPVIDYVNITSAAYSLGGNTLTVTATSSDFFTAAKQGRLAPTLTVAGFGNMTVDVNGVYTLGVAVTAPLPPRITVNSTTGGSDSTATEIDP